MCSTEEYIQLTISCQGILATFNTDTTDFIQNLFYKNPTFKLNWSY